MTTPKLVEHAYFWAVDPAHDDWMAVWPTLRGDAQRLLTLAEEQGLPFAGLIELGNSDELNLSRGDSAHEEEFELYVGAVDHTDYEADTVHRYRYFGYLSGGATSASPVAAATLLRAKVLAPDVISIHAAPEAWSAALNLYNAAFGDRPDVVALCDPAVWTNGPAKHRAPMVTTPEKKDDGMTGIELLWGAAGIGAALAAPIMIVLGWLHRNITDKSPAPDFLTTWSFTMSLCVVAGLSYMAYSNMRTTRAACRRN